MHIGRALSAYPNWHRRLVRIAPCVARYVHEWPLASEQHVTSEADGSVLLQAQVAGLVEAKRWVLSWGRHAEALAHQHADT